MPVYCTSKALQVWMQHLPAKRPVQLIPAAPNLQRSKLHQQKPALLVHKYTRGFLGTAISVREHASSHPNQQGQQTWRESQALCIDFRINSELFQQAHWIRVVCQVVLLPSLVMESVFVYMEKTNEQIPPQSLGLSLREPVSSPQGAVFIRGWREMTGFRDGSTLLKYWQSSLTSNQVKLGGSSWYAEVLNSCELKQQEKFAQSTLQRKPAVDSLTLGSITGVFSVEIWLVPMLLIHSGTNILCHPLLITWQHI